MANISELHLPDGTTKIIEDGTLWSGHRADWEALTTEEQSKYRYVMFDDDSETGETVDTVTDGDMRAVTSNAVADAINNIKDRLIATVPANTYTTYGEAIGSLNTAYQALTAEEKRNCYIQVRQGIYDIKHISLGKFITIFPYDDRLDIYSIWVVNGTSVMTSIKTSGVTIEDQSSMAQGYDISLYVRAH